MQKLKGALFLLVQLIILLPSELMGDSDGDTIAINQDRYQVKAKQKSKLEMSMPSRERVAASIDSSSTADNKRSVADSQVYVKVFDEQMPYPLQQRHPDNGFNLYDPHHLPPQPPQNYPSYNPNQKRFYYRYVPVPVYDEYTPYDEVHFPHHHDEFFDIPELKNEYRSKFEEDSYEISGNPSAIFKPVTEEEIKKEIVSEVDVEVVDVSEEILEVLQEQEEQIVEQSEIPSSFNSPDHFAEDEIEESLESKESESEVDTNVNQKVEILAQEFPKTPQLSQNVQINSHVSNNRNKIDDSNDCIKHHIIQIININARDLDGKTYEETNILGEGKESGLILLLKKLLCSSDQKNDGEHHDNKLLENIRSKKEDKEAIANNEQMENGEENNEEIKLDEQQEEKILKPNTLEHKDPYKYSMQIQDLNPDIERSVVNNNNHDQNKYPDMATSVQKIPRKRKSFDTSPIVEIRSELPLHSRNKREAREDQNYFKVSQSAFVGSGGRKHINRRRPSRSSIVQDVFIVDGTGNDRKFYEFKFPYEEYEGVFSDYGHRKHTVEPIEKSLGIQFSDIVPTRLDSDSSYTPQSPDSSNANTKTKQTKNEEKISKKLEEEKEIVIEKAESSKVLPIETKSQYDGKELENTIQNGKDSKGEIPDKKLSSIKTEKVEEDDSKSFVQEIAKSQKKTEDNLEISQIENDSSKPSKNVQAKVSKSQLATENSETIVENEKDFKTIESREVASKSSKDDSTIGKTPQLQTDDSQKASKFEKTVSKSSLSNNQQETSKSLIQTDDSQATSKNEKTDSKSSLTNNQQETSKSLGQTENINVKTYDVENVASKSMNNPQEITSNFNLESLQNEQKRKDLQQNENYKSIFQSLYLMPNDFRRDGITQLPQINQIAQIYPPREHAQLSINDNYFNKKLR